MSARQCVRVVSQINNNLWRPQFPNVGAFKATAIPFKRPSEGYLVNHMLTSKNLLLTPKELNVIRSPALRTNLEIIDPLSIFRIGIGVPKPVISNEISLPQKLEIEIVEPQQEVIEKKAARLIVIRRAKMKKHKWRKLQKKMKFIFARKRQRKEMKKEKNFQAMLLAKIKEAEKYDVEEYIASKLKTAHWEKPITRVRGFYAPDWVIRDHLRAEEERRRLNERIEDCLRLKNDTLHVVTAQPLLGSPYTCSIWEPSKLYSYNDSEQGDSRLPSPMSDSPQLIIRKKFHFPKLDNTGDELKSILKCFFSCMADLHDRLDVLLADVRQMRAEMSSITYNLKKMSCDVDRKIHHAKCNRVDMADKLYLEKLICLLNGDLRYLPLHNSPFKLFTTDVDEELNLII